MNMTHSWRLAESCVWIFQVQTALLVRNWWYAVFFSSSLTKDRSVGRQYWFPFGQMALDPFADGLGLNEPRRSLIWLLCLLPQGLTLNLLTSPCPSIFIFHSACHICKCSIWPKETQALAQLHYACILSPYGHKIDAFIEKPLVLHTLNVHENQSRATVV